MNIEFQFKILYNISDIHTDKVNIIAGISQNTHKRIKKQQDNIWAQTSYLAIGVTIVILPTLLVYMYEEYSIKKRKQHRNIMNSTAQNLDKITKIMINENS